MKAFHLSLMPLKYSSVMAFKMAYLDFIQLYWHINHQDNCVNKSWRPKKAIALSHSVPLFIWTVRIQKERKWGMCRHASVGVCVCVCFWFTWVITTKQREGESWIQDIASKFILGSPKNSHVVKGTKVAQKCCNDLFKTTLFCPLDGNKMAS